MNSKLAIFAIFYIGVISGVSADELDFDNGDLEMLVYTFFVICALILFMSIIIFIRLVITRKNKVTAMERGNRYNMTSRARRLSGDNHQSSGVYVYHTDLEPTESIYLPLSDRRNNEESDYAHLSHSVPKAVDEEEQHIYETLEKECTFTNEDIAYYNPGDIDEDDERVKKNDGSDSDMFQHSVPKEVDKEEQNIYETLEKESSFTNENAYNNPGAIDEDDENDDSDQDWFQYSALKKVDQEEQLSYRTVETENTFLKEEDTLYNKGAIIGDEKTGNDSDGSDHDYEQADASVKINDNDCGNPVEVIKPNYDPPNFLLNYEGKFLRVRKYEQQN